MYYLLFYDVAPDYLERRPAFREEHLALARAAHDRGELLLGGAFAGPPDGAVLVFRGESAAVVEAFVAADPYVRNGLVLSHRVREWTVVVGDEPPGAPDPVARLAKLRRREELGEFPDHPLRDRDGREVRLSDVFAGREELILVHNMGSRCPWCTMWADGLNGVLAHLESRAAFAVISPDPPEVQRSFAEGRGWKFRMFSAAGSPINRDAGFEDADGDPGPGVTTFRRAPDGRIHRVARAWFGPHDDFCAVWHLFDLLPGGAGEWHPRFRYGD